jgi:hypothetical protein
MKHSPIYLRLEQKYKAMKKLARERELQIEILNRQFFELAERYSFERSQRNTQPQHTDFPTPVFRHVQVPPNPEPVVEVDLENVRIVDPEPLIVTTSLIGSYVEPVELVVEEEELEEVVVDEKESDEVVVEEESDEVVVVDDESDEVVVVKEEDEEIAEDESEEVVVVEEEEEEIVEEESEEVVEEEEGVYETTINGTRYYITNDTDGEIYAIIDDDDIGDVVGRYVEGKPTFD